jgi:dihydrolipoamide dehydrogenase
MKTHDLLVIGAGPGGYVAAIRGAQMGLDVACIEAEPRLGGTCLRVGCIPSKALLESSERFVEARHSLAKFGVKVDNVELDLPTMLGRKDEVVKNLTDGIAFLFKKNKITRYIGHGEFTAANKVKVVGPDGDEEIEAKHIIIATGSKPAMLRGISFDYDIIGLPVCSRTSRCDWRRCYRP